MQTVEGTNNQHSATVAGFGDEWTRFDQSHLSSEERSALFESYFSVFPWDALTADAEGFDLGCGSGRWAQCVAPRVGRLHCIDASDAALSVARRNLRSQKNCTFHHASVDALPLAPGTMDFGYSLGVLHHVPDTLAGLASCVRLLKPGAPFLVYLYYALDNRPCWLRALWRTTDAARRVISRLPVPARYGVSQAIAATVYYPLARAAALIEWIGLDPDNVPLAAYRDRSFKTMRTDALDRFGTQLEQRFTRDQVHDMMTRAGLRDIRFGEQVPYWCAVGYRTP